MSWKEKRKAGDNSKQPANNQQMTSRKTRSVFRYAAMLLMLLTLGVGQMWGADTYAIAGSMNSWSTTANTRSGTGAISITFSSTGNYTFKIVKNGTWCGNSGTMTRDNCTSWGFTYNGGDNCTISVDKTGTYTFNITNSTPTLSVTYPDPTWSVAGGFNSWSTTTNTFSSSKTSINLTNGTTYEFKVYRKEGNVYYGNDGTMTSANCSNWDFSSSKGNAKITANITGTYVVELVNNTPRITVHYPVAISYNKGTNGTGTISGGVKTWGADYTLSSSTFTRTGYDQDGWATSDGGSKAYNLGGTYSTHTAQTFYPHWVEKTYNLTFSHNGHGTIEVGDATVASGSTASVNHINTKTLVATPNTGYDFSGWSLSGSNTSAVTIGNTSNASTTIKATNTGATVTAGFTAKTTTVTLDNQGATTAGEDEITATYDAAVPSIAGNLPAKTGYTFGGYYTSTGGSGTKYINADGTSAKTWNIADATKTLYAKWTEITHDVRATTSALATTSPSSWTAFGEVTGGTVSATSISTGYRFNGWSASSGTFADASSATTTYYPTTDDTWVTASIVAKTYTVTLDKNGGDSDGSITTTYNSSTGSSFSAASRAGYTCDGYFTASDGGTEIIDKDGNLKTGTVDGWLSSGNWVKDAADITLYAHWTASAVQYNLSFGPRYADRTLGSVAAVNTSTSASLTSGQNYDEGTGVTATATPVNDNYKFDSWYNASSGGKKIAGAGNPYVFTLSKDTGVYAHFVQKTTVITLNANGGSGGSSSVTATHGSNTLPSFTAPTRSGYTFNGWYTEESGGTRVILSTGVLPYNAGAYTDASANWDYDESTLTLYGHWTAKTYKVTFDKQSGSSGSDNVTATYNAAMPAATMPTRTGYDFQGYYGSTGGSGTKYYNANGSSAHVWDVASAQTIYAYWTIHNYTITYSPSSAPTGCTYTTKPTTGTYGNTVTMVITPSTGYTVSVSAVDAGSSPVTISNPSTNTYTFTQPASNVTVTVTATETMSTLSTSNSYDGANPSWSAPTKSVSSIGISTTATVTAHANDLGYTLTSWTITGGVRTDGGGANANPITVRSNGDGAAVSVTANYVGSNRSVNIYLPNTGNSWSTSDNNWRFYKLPGESGETVTLAVDIDKYDYSSSSYKLGFNVYQAGWSDKWWHNKSDGDSNMDAHNCTNWGFNTKDGDHKTNLDLNVSGTYTFTLTNSNSSSTQKLSVTYPDKSFIEGAFPTAWSEDAYTLTEDGDIQSVTINITSTGDKEFRLVSHGKLFGTSTKITNAANTQTLSAKNMSDAGAVMTIGAYVTGNYTFSYNKSTKVLTVTWPIYNQVRISAASPDDATNRGNFDLSSPVSNVRSVTRSLNAGTTYTFKVVYNSDWYGYDSGAFTRSTSTSSNSLTTSTSGGDMTLTTDYAGDYTFKFNQSTKALSVDFPAAYKITFGKGSVNGTTGSFSAVNLSNGNSAVSSNSTWVKSGHNVKITAPSAKSGYRFLGWYDNNSATGDAITTNANCTISVTAATTVYACYAENKTSITITTDGHGTITTPSPNSSPYSLGVTTGQAIDASPSTGYLWNTWTTSGTAAVSSPSTKSNTVNGNGTNGSTGTVTATFTPITYTIAFNANGGSGTMTNQTGVAYDSETAIKANAFTRTGYTFAGWAESAGGAVVRADGAAHGNLSSTQGGTVTLYAKWTPKTSALTLDKQTSATGYGSAGTATASAAATYGSAMPALTGALPTAANGYAFMGFYDATEGGGTKYYNADGTSAHNWDKDVTSGTTLYAYYKKAEITALTFDAVAYDPEGTVGVTPTIDPTPVGDKIICWTVLQSNDSPLDPQPAITWDGTKATFAASAYSGTYKVQAVLRTGTSCGGGTVLDTRTESFSVAGSHTVTVNYKCGSDVIKTATSVTATPLAWSEDITAPDIFGYTFTRWDAVDGVTIKNGESTPVTTSTNATIKIKATYHGQLTAVYTQKNMIFFKNTLGWSDVYVNFYTEAYWNNPKGSGNKGKSNCNLHMTRNGETDIWYYDYGAASITPTLYVSFTSDSQDNAQYFWKSGGVNVVYPANYPDAINTDKSSENGFKAATPMFVPLATQEAVVLNNNSGGKAEYYNAGYWTMYTPGTGYTLEIYNNSTGAFIKSETFTSADELMPMKAVVDLEGGQTYKFQLRRGGTSSAGVYYGNTGTMTYANHGQGTPWDMTNTMSPSFTMARITTNAAGSYTFHLSYSGNSATPPHYRLRMAVDYPVADGDYRVIYKDNVHTLWHPSAIVSKVNNGKDTVSFFVRPGSSPQMKIQTATVNPSTGAVTWGSDVAIASATLTGLAGTDVYNFNLTMDGSGNISLESVDTYTGNFYIRTDAANSKWDNYKSDQDHRMTYSEYSIEHGGYTHYYTHWVNKDVTGRKNVKFVIANDYSPCISDTMTRETASGTWENIDKFIDEGGDLKRSANVRFMWDKRDNSISRAYVDGAQGDWSENFLYMLNVEAGADKIRKTDESALTDHKITFKDNGNWMYEANIQAQPTAQIKLLSNWGTSNTITQYFRGGESSTETLLGGSGDKWYDIRVIYDFKTNRLIAGLIPSGEIDEQMAIHADVMFIREHQGDIAQLTFAKKDGKMGAITDIETAYGVLQFNKWTINNKSKAAGHAPLVPALSRFERDLFYVSFPFRVSMEEVFGFGTYGTHWIIEYYDGANRAANGYWLESDPNWKFIWDRKGKFFEPGQGYIIALELDELGESSSVWTNTDQVELYFPSYGTMDNITSSTATYNIPAHECTINRSHESNGHGGTLGDAYDRRVKDSHWNVLGVPTYVNPDAPNYANTAWITTADSLHIGPNFLYQVNWNDNTVSPVSASTFTYHAMHAYLVQYCGNVTWTSSVSVNPSAAPRRNKDYRGEYEFRLEMLQNDEAVDQTFVKLSDNEAVTTGFEFNYDMSKEFNKKKANIYTLIGTEQVAGNVLPLTEQTTVVPVGVQIKTNGEYTFSMPEGTEGIGVTLIDNETGLRTPLGLTDYTISLEAGTYDERFVLEIAPIKGTATDIEEAVSDQHSAIRKVMVDGILYIVKDGKVFDARGARIQ